MGTFTSKIKNEKRKHPTLSTATVIVADDDLETFADYIRALPDSYSATATKRNNTEKTVSIEMSYEARGANRHDIARRLRKAPVTATLGRAKQPEMLCDCTSSNASCTA